MTFDETLTYIENHGEYHKDGKITFKLKVAPLNTISLMRYQTDLLVNRKILSNEDAKIYTNEDSFVIIPYDVKTLPEESFHV